MRQVKNDEIRSTVSSLPKDRFEKSAITKIIILLIFLKTTLILQ